jgi:demethylmenaquinone methyltransferase/2-methoxy-6-polyprenyl-1,4-benzoquinol methylase
MFDRIAPRYDLLNRLLSAGIDQSWRRACVDALELPPGGRVLDLCTGTADVLLEALRRDPNRAGVGLDVSFEMLARGAAKGRAAGLGARMLLVAGDAERLPIQKDFFDGASVAFGIRSVSNIPAALAELRRVLRPGAKLAVLEFSMPDGLFGRVYRAYSTHVLPRVGRLLSGDRDAYTYLPRSIERFPAPTEFERMMSAAGFAEVRHRPLTRGVAQLYRGEKR